MWPKLPAWGQAMLWPHTRGHNFPLMKYRVLSPEEVPAPSVSGDVAISSVFDAHLRLALAWGITAIALPSAVGFDF